VIADQGGVPLPNTTGSITGAPEGDMCPQTLQVSPLDATVLIFNCNGFHFVSPALSPFGIQRTDVIGFVHNCQSRVNKESLIFLNVVQMTGFAKERDLVPLTRTTCPSQDMLRKWRMVVDEAPTTIERY
jgi:hypothetical protein